MGLRSFANKVGGGIEHGVDKVKKKAGEFIDDGAHIVGDGLDHVGLDDAADWVEDKGDQFADHLGADVAEQQLGQTDQPEELLHGDAGKIRDAAAHLAKFATAFDTGHTGLSHLDPGDWKGLGADAFRAKFTAQPAKWAKAATACTDAAVALEAYAETVEWARGQAKEAVRLWKQGQAKRKTAADAYNANLDKYHDDVKAYNGKVDDGKDPGTKPVEPGAFTDPGAADKQSAKDTLDAARKQRDDAAVEAQATVKAATELAPAKPDFTDRMKHDGSDIGKAAPIAGEHFVGGLVRSGTDMLKFARGLNPYDPYNLTHPAQYLTHLNATAAGLLDMTQHPERLPAAVLGTGWGSDGSEAGGRLIGNILLTIATDGGSTAAKATVEGAAKNAAKDTAEQAARGTARAAAEDPLKAAIKKAAKNCVTDPIDVATGDMILTQTDLSLPGTLPLVLERTHLSSYRTGGLFGPSWASTLDQRLELDDDGAVFVTDDGALLLYPVPGPAGPVLPLEGPRWPLEWDGTPGSPLRVTDADTGRVLHFTAVQAAPGTAGGPMVLPLTEVRDRNGNGYAISYEGGLPAAIRHSGGYLVTVDSDGRRVTGLHLAAAGAPAAVVRSFGYDAAGRLTEAADSTGVPYRFTYDTAGRVTSWTDRNDSTYTYAYDPLGRCVRTRGRHGFLSSTLTYDDATRTTAFTDSLGHRRTYRHDDAYRLVAETDPLGHTTVREWDAAHRLAAVTDPLGGTTRYTYDDAGRITSVTRPDGTRTLAAYNALGLPVTVTDPDGAVWRQTYDAAGNPVTRGYPSGDVARYAHDEQGRLTAVTDVLGHTTRVRCNAAGLPVETTDPAGATTLIDWDAFGRPLAVTDPLGGTTGYVWTTEGRLTSRTTPDGATESWAYDPEGNETVYRDALGGTTRSQYTHFDLLTARTGPDGTRHTFTHDTELRLTTVGNPQGLTWEYAYDAAGRLVRETDFDDRSVGYARDAAGRMSARTDPLGHLTRYERDPLGRIVRQDAAGAVSHYAYDDAGRLTRAANDDATVTRHYDVMGRLMSEAVNGSSIAYAYDAAGRRVSRTTPGGAHTGYAYDPAGNRTELSAAGRQVAFGRDAAGREVTRTLGDVVLALSYDAMGRVASQRASARTPGSADDLLVHRDYSYRADGQLIGIEDPVAGFSRRFDLDPVGRVTGVSAADWTESYAYDEAGNQTRAALSVGGHAPAPDGPRTYRGTRLTGGGNVRYEYDAAGRTVLRQKKRLSRPPETWRYAWNPEGRMTRLTTPDGTVWHYRYDPFGRRIAKQRLDADARTVTEQVDFTWDGSLMVEENRPASRFTVTWDHDGLHPLAQSERTRLTDTDVDIRFFAIVTDLIGAPTELVDDTGGLAWRNRATVWGSTVVDRTSTADTPLRFPGQYHDAESGLHYNFHRYYDPETGRYTSPDPLGLLPADNPVTYVDNPQTSADPTGLAECLGLRDEAQRAIEKFENIKKDPLGKINSEANHNHYDAARREANGEVVARRPDGTPYDHIQDLTQAKLGLQKVRKTLEREIDNPPDTITSRGIDVLVAKHKEVVRELDRLTGFLHSIGH